MRIIQNLKWKNVTPPAAIVDNAAFTTATLDTQETLEWAFIVSLGALDIAVAAMKVTESDASNMGSATDVSGADFSVSPLTLPAADADNNLYLITGASKGRKRYLDLSLTGGDGSTGSYVSVLAVTVPKIGPDTATERGVAQQAIV